MPTGPQPGDAAREPSLHPLERVGVAVAVVAGLGLRFWTRSRLWLDEALTVHIARLPLGDIPAALRHDGHPPLYYFLLHGWMSVFGEGDSAVRALSGVFAVAALPLAWLAGRRFGPVAGAALVALLALSPFAIRYGTEARMYSLVMLLVLAGYLLVVHALERPSVARLAGVAAVTGALLLSHYWALWLLAAVWIVLALRARSRSGPARQATLRVLLAVTAGAVFLLPWLGVMLDQSAHTGTPWADPVRPTTLVTNALQDFGGGDYAEGLLLGWGLLVLFGVGLTARAADPLHLDVDVRTRPELRPEALVVGGTVLVATLAGYATNTTFATRYAAVLFPVFLLVAAVGVSQFAGVVARGVVAASLLLLGIVGGVHNGVTDRTQLGQVADVIRSDGRPGDVVLICPDQLGPALSRLLTDDLGLSELSYPTLGDPSFVDWRDYEARNAAADPVATADEVIARANRSSSIWLVMSGSYKTFEGQCEAVERQLGLRVGGGSVRVVEDGDEFFEHATLLQYPGPGP